MGTVYEAEHTMIGAKCAIKLLHVAFASDPAVVKRFMNEARAAGMLGHPNILKATDMGRAADGSPFAVLELLEGRDLGQEMEASGPMPVGRVVRIAMQVASALSAAHVKGIVHRDMKPDNIFLTEEHGQKDFVKVLDFGISKFTASLASSPGTNTGTIMGTPYYMAPEQARDASKVDERADIYALGAIVYEALSGRVPHPADSLPALMVKIISEEPTPLSELRSDLPSDLVAVVEKSLAKDPDARFSSMDDLAQALEPFAAIDASPVLTKPVDSHRTAVLAETPMAAESVRPPTPVRASKPWKLIVIAASAVVGLGAAATTMLNGTDEAAAPVETVAAPASEEQSEPDVPPAGIEVPAEPMTVVLSIESPDDGAEVELRGETHSLPYRMEMSRSSQPESVTVRAHRREGRRFWLVMDESRSLWVDLERGRGVQDASDPELERFLAGRPTENAADERRGSEMRRPSMRISAAPVMEAPMVAAPPVVAPPEEESTAAPIMTATMHGTVYTGAMGDIPDSI